MTAGGSICIEALNLTGSPEGWQPSYCAESMLQLIIANMVDCESVYVQTPTGPGGLSGPLRVDLDGKHCTNPMQASTCYAVKYECFVPCIHAGTVSNTGLLCCINR